MPPPIAPTPGSIVGGKYRVDNLLGEGGMGAVFAAQNTVTGKRVALKWMHAQFAADPQSAQRFIREAQASARVQHPNVVDVYDVVDDGGSLFLVMEFLEGEPLSALMERQQVPMHEVLLRVRQAMRGVAAAHKQGVIHRDIKPDNIFLAREGDEPQPIPKVLDFGISKVSGSSMSMTGTGAVLGTPLYMSVEQLSGVKDIDARTDIYAFGVILYQVVTGTPPFTADTFPALIARIMTEQAPDPKALRPDVPTSLIGLIRRAMAKDRNERIATLDQLIAELEPFTHETGFRGQMTLGGGQLPHGATPSSRPIARVAPSSAPSAAAGAPGVPRPGAAIDEDSVSPVTRRSDEAVHLPRASALPMRLALAAVVLALGVGAWLALGADRGAVAGGADEPNLVKPAAAPPAEVAPAVETAPVPVPVPVPVPAPAVEAPPLPAANQPERTRRVATRTRRADATPDATAAPASTPDDRPKLRAPSAAPPASVSPTETGEPFRAGKPSRSDF